MMRRTSYVVVIFTALVIALPALAQPNLEIGLLWATEENDIVNDECITQVHYILQIFNAGTEDAGPFTMHVVIDAPELPAIAELDDYMGLTHDVEDGIKAMDMYQIELWWKEDGGLPPGYWTSWMLIDIDDEVAESNEDDNTDGPIYVETNPPTCEPANLLIESFTTELVDGVLQYAVVVASESSQAFPEPVRLDLYHHRDKEPGYYDPGDQTVMLEALGEGETYAWQTDWELPAEDGVFRSYVVVDGDNDLFENTEADNIAGSVTIICPDCPPCEDGEPVNEACKCGGTLVADGFCCDGTVQVVKCFSGAEEESLEVVEETTAADIVEMVEETGTELIAQDDWTEDKAAGEQVDSAGDFDDAEGSKKKNKGCLAGATPSGSAAPLCLLFAVAFLALIRRRIMVT